MGNIFDSFESKRDDILSTMEGRPLQKAFFLILSGYHRGQLTIARTNIALANVDSLISLLNNSRESLMLTKMEKDSLIEKIENIKSKDNNEKWDTAIELISKAKGSDHEMYIYTLHANEKEAAEYAEKALKKSHDELQESHVSFSERIKARRLAMEEKLKKAGIA